MPARTRADAPEMPRERESRERQRTADCAAETALFFPGLGHVCQGRTAEAAVFMGLGAAELGTAAAVMVHRDEGLAGASHPAAAAPLIALQNLWAYSYADALFEEQRAGGMRYVPQDTPAELATAPFNPSVLRHTDVWLGTLVMATLGVGLSLWVEPDAGRSRAGEDPNLFGRTVDRSWGYPAAGAIGVGLFQHVAMGEEALFRGIIQSEMTRRSDETAGWVGGSLFFGFAHATNALAVPGDQSVRYLLYGVPYITTVGSFLGHSYRRHSFSLAPPVAIHFWYNLLLSASFFALDPTDSPLSARVSLPF